MRGKGFSSRTPRCSWKRAGRRGKPATVAERRVEHLEQQLSRKEAKLLQKNEVIAELMEENVRGWSSRTEIAVCTPVLRLGISSQGC